MPTFLRFRNALVVALLLAASPVFAAADYLLEIEGIPGESTEEAHVGAIELQSWSVKAANTSVAGGAGKVSFSDVQLVKRLDKSSPQLFLHCASGTHIPQAILHVRKAGNDRPVEYYKITFSDILVTSVQTSGSSGGDPVPTETFSLNFTKIEFEYKPQNADGTVGDPVKSGWDIAANKPI